MSDANLPAPDATLDLDAIIDHFAMIDLPLVFAKPDETPKHTKEQFAVAVVDAFCEQFPKEVQAIGIVEDVRYPPHVVVFQIRKRLITDLDLQLLGDRIEARLAEMLEAAA